MAAGTIFTRFIAALGVPHTVGYSDARFRDMTFKSLYGLSHLLKTYGIENGAVRVSDKSEVSRIPVPFLAQTIDGTIVIVTYIDTAEATVTYDYFGDVRNAFLKDFTDSWNGIALMAWPSEESREPGYPGHRLSEIITGVSRYALAVAALAVVAYFFITRGVYAHVCTVLLALFNSVGLYLSFLLIQKSLHIRSAASSRMCGILEEGGCDSVMSLKVSRLFGVFSWSEIGFAYFGVSLITLLIFPHMWPSLALCNVCCLPYTFWSIWYQRFRARHWCTLCVGVQTTLWILFFCYLSGGLLRHAFPVHIDFFVLIAVYVFAVLFLNMLMRFFKTYEKDTPT